MLPIKLCCKNEYQDAAFHQQMNRRDGGNLDILNKGNGGP